MKSLWVYVYLHITSGDYLLGMPVHTLGYNWLSFFCLPQSGHTREEHGWEDGMRELQKCIFSVAGNVYARWKYRQCTFYLPVNKISCDPSATEDNSWNYWSREVELGIPKIKRLLYHFSS